MVPVALCNLWGSLFGRRDTFWKRRPYKLWARVDVRVGKPIPPGEVTPERLQLEIQKLRGEDR